MLAPTRYNTGIKSTEDPLTKKKHPFNSNTFNEALEAAGYLQRLDTSEERITKRYQHALGKMSFAAHSEAFVNQTTIQRVHGSTVQFFSEDPVSDPFVHIQVSHLPPNKQFLITPTATPTITSGWTPIGSRDEAEGTRHFTVSFPGFWPFTVVFDCNQEHLAREDRYHGLGLDSESDHDDYIRSARSKPTRRAGYPDYSDSSTDSDDEGYVSGGDRYGSSRRRSDANGYASASYSRAYESGAGRYGTVDSDAYGGAGGSSRRRSRSRARSTGLDAYPSAPRPTATVARLDSQAQTTATGTRAAMLDAPLALVRVPVAATLSFFLRDYLVLPASAILAPGYILPNNWRTDY
ncbi:hypothetical protein OIO90_000110 [Microbotryomycetes sp. JL221]|nr:hypothetical protein OIO90_000110 [Microbotryomycetes sp. JL221]